MENLNEIQKCIKRLGKAYSKARSSDKKIAFEINTKSIFESICKSIVDSKIYLPTEGLDTDFISTDIEKDGNTFIGITKSLGVSMFAINLRSPYINIDGGRIYKACSIKENNSINDFHDKLLNLYFNLFGRINTFNERMFEHFIELPDKSPKIFRVKFNSDYGIKLLNISKNSYTINISPVLANSLITDSLINKIIYPPTSGIEQLDWLQYIKEEKIKNQLDSLVEKQWHKILSEESTITEWSDLLLFLDSVSNDTTIRLEWNSITIAHLKKALKFIQGISIYRLFAPVEIVSILSFLNKEKEIFGVTIGFNQDEIDTNEFIGALSNQIEEFGNDILPTRVQKGDSSVIGKSPLPDSVFGPKNWEAIKKDIDNNTNCIDLFSKCSEIIVKIKGLAFALHEGHDIKFTLYFGRQPSLSRFNEIYGFTAEDIENLDLNFRSYLKSHYSLFQSNLNGLFIDVVNNSQISLVKPLSILPKITDTKHLDLLEIESILGNQPDESRLKLITESDPNLLALQVGLRQMKIFYKGVLYLKWPGGDDFSWERNIEGEWNDEAKIFSLIEKLISLSKIKDESEKKYVSSTITKTILRISGESGKGGLLIFGKNTQDYLLDGYKSRLNFRQLAFWKGRRINQCDSDDLYNMIIPDGATLFNLTSLKIENQIQVIPIDDKGKAMDLALISSNGDSKGTKHMTGKAISLTKAKKIIIICISADGPVTVYYCGTELVIGDLNTIELNEP